MSVISAFGIAQTFIASDLSIYEAQLTSTGALQSIELEWETYFSYFGYVVDYLFQAIERIHQRTVANYASDWYVTIPPEQNYRCAVESMPDFSQNMYSEFNTYIYKFLRDPFSGFNQSMWEGIGTEYADYINDISGSTYIPIYEFAKLDYNNEFETFF